MIIIENNQVREIEPYEPIDMPQEWTLNDTLPYQAMARYEMIGDEVNLIQIYVKRSERRKGLARKIFKYLEKKGKVRIRTTAEDTEIFGKFLKKMGYKRCERENEFYVFRKTC